VERSKLCLASPHFFPTYGGAQMRYLRYLPGWRARGLDTWVATGTPMLEERTEVDRDLGWYAHAPGELLPVEEVDGAPVHRVRLPDEKGMRRSLIFYRTVVSLCRQPELRPDAVQFVSNLRARAIPWLVALRRMGIATLYSVSQFPTWPNKPVKRIWRRHFYRTLYNSLDCIVTNSDPLADFLRGIGVKTRIEMIPNGVDLERFHPSDDEQARATLRRSLSIPDDALVVVSVGAVMPRKGQDLLLESWRSISKDLPEAHLLLVGPRADLHDPKLEDFGARIVSLAAASGAADRIHFTGMTDDVEKYLRASDVFVLASKREGFPNSVLEAMASGLPVVVTPFVGRSPSMGDEGEHYLLAEREPDAVGACLCRLLESREERARLGGNGLRLVREHFAVEHSLDRYVALYRELGAAAKR
jgi:glycosyltransferase involved in cell wall biosynthesis